MASVGCYFSFVYRSRAVLGQGVIGDLLLFLKQFVHYSCRVSEKNLKKNISILNRVMISYSYMRISSHTSNYKLCSKERRKCSLTISVAKLVEMCQ